MTDTTREVIQKRVAALEKDRSSFVSQWRDLGELMLPRRGRFGSTNGDNERGRKKGQRIVRGIAQRAVTTMAAGMMSGLTSPARPWFGLSVADTDLADFTPVRRWLDDVALRMLQVLARSNFYTALQPAYRELGVFGTAPIAMLDDAADVVRFYPQTAGSYALAHDDRLQVNTFARTFELTVGQLHASYGDRVSRRVREAFTSNRLDQKIPVAQLIQPNADHLPGWKGARGFPFRSFIIEVSGDAGDTQTLEDKGFHEFPILGGRWETMPETPYGTNCPGMDALSDVREIQFVAKRNAELLDKGNNPPLEAPGSLQGKAIGLFPGAITFRPPTQGESAGVVPIYTPDPRWFQFSREGMQDLEAAVHEAFFVDLFRMLQQLDGVQPRNQMELNDRREEKLLLLGPVLEQLNADWFNPLIDRLFAIMWRRGLIPEPPPDLEGVPLQVEYTSAMAQAQRAIAAGGIERFVTFGASIAAVAPQALDKIDFDQVMDDYATATGIHSRLVRSDEEAAAIREQRAQAQQMAQMAELAPALAQGVGAAAKAAETVPKDGNLLEALSG